MPALGRSMSIEEIVARIRFECEGQRRRRRADETISDDRQMIRCRTKHDSSHHADFRAADLCKYVRGIASIRLIDFDSSTNDRDLARQTLIIYACSPASYGFRITTEQNGGDCARRCSVSYSHLTNTEQVDSITGSGTRQFDTCRETRFGFKACHRRTNGEVGRAAHYLCMNQLSAIGEICIDAGIYDPHFDSTRPPQHPDTR